MIRIFKNLEEYNAFTNNGHDLMSGDLYWVEDSKSAFFLTNNIDGDVKKYDMLDEIPDGYIVPSGNIAITENGEGIDVTNYATATVNVPSTGGGNEDLINLIERDITTLNIPDGTTKIGNYAFYYYSGLTDVTIPESMTSIQNYAFAYCSKLTSVTIPESVTSIQNYAFRDCSALTAITVLAATPLTLGIGVFTNTNNCPIYVPAASVDAYKTATNWSKYASRIYAIGSVVEGGPSGGGPSGGDPSEGPTID